MKLRGGDSTPTSDSGDRHNELREFVSALFMDATLQESFADRLVFSVPQQSVPSLANCFMQLEKGNLTLSRYSMMIKDVKRSIIIVNVYFRSKNRAGHRRVQLQPDDSGAGFP